MNNKKARKLHTHLKLTTWRGPPLALSTYILQLSKKVSEFRLFFLAWKVF